MGLEPKAVKAQGADMLMTLLGASIAADPKAHAETKRAAWCRDPASNRLRGVYRPVGGSPGYLIALQDAGRTMGVWPSLGAQIGKEGAAPWSISLAEVDGSTSVLPSFDRLPAPDQVVALASGPASGRVSATPGKKPGDRTITIDPKAL